MIEAPKEMYDILKKFLEKESLLDDFKKAFKNSKEHHKYHEYNNSVYCFEFILDLTIDWGRNDSKDWGGVSSKFCTLYCLTHKPRVYKASIRNVENYIVNTRSIKDVFKIAKDSYGRV